jgi:hypothetical protein
MHTRTSFCLIIASAALIDQMHAWRGLMYGALLSEDSSQLSRALMRICWDVGGWFHLTCTNFRRPAGSATRQEYTHCY